MKKLLSLGLTAVMILIVTIGCSSAGSSHYEPVASSASSDGYAPAPAAEQPALNMAAGYDADYGRNSTAIRGETDDYEEEAVYDEADIDEGDAPEEGGAMPESGGLGGGVNVQNVSTDNRKIVITVDLSLQTMEFETGTSAIVELTQSMGGYVQDSYVEGASMYDKYMSRSASYTVRIPKAKLDEFLAAVAGKFNVVSERQTSTDISMQYYDNKARLESLRVQEERLMAMLSESNELKYMLQVEQELANVLYEIESITSSLNRMDDSVDLSTVTIYLQEVVKYEESPPVKPVTFGERISYTFGDSWDSFVYFCQDFVLFFVALVPFLPVILVIAVVLFLLIRVNRKRLRARQAAMPQQQPFPPVYTIPQPPQGPGPEPPSPAPVSGKDNPDGE